MIVYEEKYMRRALDLAALAGRGVRPNPNVGCVIVRGHIIIGEGYHKRYGDAHAEVNAFNDAIKNNNHPDESCVVYVTLEPCGHFGKTPPCAELIAGFRPAKVFIGTYDLNPLTAGKGLDILTEHKIPFEIVGHAGSEAIIRTFNKNILQKKPYIILKYARTTMGVIGDSSSRLKISDTYTSRLTHRWRSETDGILIGKNTLVADDPGLDNRYAAGPSPRPVLVLNKLPHDWQRYSLFKPADLPVLITSNPDLKYDGPVIFLNPFSWSQAWMKLLEDFHIYQLLVEGGPRILQSIIDSGEWDELRRITSLTNNPPGDLREPRLSNYYLTDSQLLINDRLETFFLKNG